MNHKGSSDRILFGFPFQLFGALFLPLLLSCGGGDGGGVTGPSEVAVGSVTIVSEALNLPIRAETPLMVLVKDQAGALLTGRTVTFSTANAQVATVDSNGLVTAVGEGSATITASAGGKSSTVAVSVSVLDFVSISAGETHTCGLTDEGRAWCWGSHMESQLGIGDDAPIGNHPHAVQTNLTFKAIDARGHTCALTDAGKAYCWGILRWGNFTQGTSVTWPVPTAAPGGLTFQSIKSGTCGLTADGSAYCWGDNSWSQLGSGDALAYDSFVPVVGGLKFEKITVGTRHTCGMTTGGAAFCWGEGEIGLLGNGTRDGSGVPIPVSGDHIFQSLASAHYKAACGVTVGGDAYCWGWWGWHYGGDFSTTSDDIHDTPTLIPGGLKFRSLSVGWYHGCGLTVDDKAFCWGANEKGQFGNGGRSSTSTPTPVSGGHTFVEVTTGGDHTCGLTTSGSVYCWGDNSEGQLGAGSDLTDSANPVLVHGSR